MTVKLLGPVGLFLSTGMAAQAQQAIFSDVDVSGDGVVTAEEFFDAFRTAGMGDFIYMDENGDGFITRDEAASRSQSRAETQTSAAQRTDARATNARNQTVRGRPETSERAGNSRNDTTTSRGRSSSGASNRGGNNGNGRSNGRGN